MLSEKHDNNCISYWLTEWLRTVKTPPKLIITDQSLALMHAIIKSFTQFSNLNVYLSNCSKLIMKEPGADIPTCMIRNDFNHIMHLVSSWTEMKSCNYRIKNFYMRSIGLLVISTSFEDIKNILKLIFTVALNETDGLNIYKVPTECEIAKNYLKQKIATHNIEIDEVNERDTGDLRHYLENDNEEIINVISIFDEIKQIYLYCEESSKVNANTSGDHDNMQYSPRLAKKVLEFSKLIPCWSTVMVPIFGYGNLTESSATSESLFKDLKSVIFKHKTLPLRLDDFFMTHVNSIIGLMNLIAPTCLKRPCQKSENEDKEPQSKVKTVKNSADLDEDNVENWKGLGELKKFKRRSTYVDKDPTVLYYNDNSRTKSSVIGILKNGGIAELKTIYLDNVNVSVIKTCAFDTFAQIWFCAYVDSTQYAEYVVKNSKNVFMALVLNAIRDGVNAQTYKKRAMLLKQMFNDNLRKSELDGTIVVDTACTSQYMIRKLFGNFPSTDTTLVCPKCLNTYLREEIIITVNLPTDNLIFLQDVMANHIFSTSNCEKCNTNMTDELNFKEHLIIEPVVPLTKQRKTKNHLDLDTKLKDIPIILKVKKDIYYLRGLVNFIPPISNTINAIGHYIAYCYREINKTWEKYDDLQPKAKSVRPTTEIQNCQYLIYTK